MRSFLALAHDFPPCASMGGGIRSAKFAHYLGDFGWKAHVIACPTLDPQPAETYSPVQRVPPRLKLDWPWQLTSQTWFPWEAAAEAMQRESLDLIYVSCPPFHPSILASFLKLRLGKPLVVDFRDPWRFDAYRHHASWAKSLYQVAAAPPLEAAVVAACDALITCTPSTGDCYRRHYPWARAKIHEIPNGYDEADFKDLLPPPAIERHHILHAGSLGLAGRHPDLIFKAFREVLREHPLARLQFAGIAPEALRREADDGGIAGSVDFLGRMSHSQALEAMRRSGVLLLFQAPTAEAVSPIGGKTYEYIRCERPILAVAPQGDNLDVLGRYAGRYEGVSDFSVSSIARALGQLLTESASGPATFPPRPGFRDDCDRQALAGRLAEVFRQVTARQHDA